MNRCDGCGQFKSDVMARMNIQARAINLPLCTKCVVKFDKHYLNFNNLGPRKFAYEIWRSHLWMEQGLK